MRRSSSRVNIVIILFERCPSLPVFLRLIDYFKVLKYLSLPYLLNRPYFFLLPNFIYLLRLLFFNLYLACFPPHSGNNLTTPLCLHYPLMHV